MVIKLLPCKCKFAPVIHTVTENRRVSHVLLDFSGSVMNQPKYPHFTVVWERVEENWSYSTSSETFKSAWKINWIKKNVAFSRPLGHFFFTALQWERHVGVFVHSIMEDCLRNICLPGTSVENLHPLLAALLTKRFYTSGDGMGFTDMEWAEDLGSLWDHIWKTDDMNKLHNYLSVLSSPFFFFFVFLKSVLILFFSVSVLYMMMFIVVFKTCQEKNTVSRKQI